MAFVTANAIGLGSRLGHLLPPGVPQAQALTQAQAQALTQAQAQAQAPTQSPTRIRMRCWSSCFDLVEVRGIGAEERSDIDRLSVAKVDVTGVDRSNGAFGCRLRCGRINHHGFLLDMGAVVIAEIGRAHV